MGVSAVALRVKQMLSPSTPSAGSNALYPKADNNWYSGDPTGAETMVSNSARTLAPVRACSGQADLTLSGLQTVDGVALAAGDRVLASSQTTTANSGVYVAASGAWARATDADTAAKVVKGTKVRVLEGTQQKYKEYTQYATVTTIGTDAQAWRVITQVDMGGMFAFPQPQGTGHLYFNNNQKALYVHNGISWQALNGPVIVTSTTRPNFPSDELLIYETDTGNAYVYSGGQWKPYGGVNGGVMLAPVRVSSSTATVTLSGLQTVDGVALTAGDRVLVRWNGPATDNGIYVVAAGAWSRAPDADTAAKIKYGTKVMALEGLADRWKIFTQTKAVTTIGTDIQEWRLHLAVDSAGSLQYPQTLGEGHLYWDKNAKSLAGWDHTLGNGWVRLNGMRICTSTTRPGFVGDDSMIFESDTGNAYIWQGGGWKTLGAVVVEDENATPREVSKLDFQGAGVAVTAGAAGEAIVTIAGGGAGSDEVAVQSTAPASTLELWYDTTATAAPPRSDTAWFALPMSTGWTPQGGAFEVPRYRRLGDIVYLEGMPLHGTTGTAQIGILPAGFRPLKTRYFPTRYWTGSAVGVGTFSIGNDGAITMEQFVNNSTSNLDGTLFSTI